MWSPDYYLTEPVVSDDAKGVGPLMMAYAEKACFVALTYDHLNGHTGILWREIMPLLPRSPSGSGPVFCGSRW